MSFEKRYHILFVLALTCFTTGSKIFAQPFTEPSKMKQFNITVNFEDYTVKTQMLSQDKKIDLNNDRSYMWYTSQKIMETKGGYAGKLIHGSYKAFYLNNQLKEQGEIKYGLKNKEWKYWYPDGKLKEVITWKSGIKNGPYYLYNDYGQLMAQSNFKNDKLNGKFYTYGNNGAILEKKKYKNGNEIIKKVKQKKVYQPAPQNTNQEPAKPKEKAKPAQPKKKIEKTKKQPAEKKEKKSKKSGSSKNPVKEEKRKVITS